MNNWKKFSAGKNGFFLLLLAWFIINFVQAAFTGITNDESYYALWGKQLAWGYFDHPPMVALYTHLSSFLFNGTLGVRFITVLSQIGVLLLTWLIIDEKQADFKKATLFFILAGSLIMFSMLGFICTPDAPLLLFTAFFLLAYKRFLKQENWLNTLLISLAMSGMVYSKYQAGLVIAFTILSNWRLLLKPTFWLAGLGALLLLLPHFLWQFNHQFPSFQFHLVDRSKQFQLIYFLEYLPNQLVIFNPLTLGLVVYSLVRYKSHNLFEKGLHVQIVGFLLFFWVMAYRGHVEPHWTVACSIPMIVLLYQRAKEQDEIKRFIRRYLLGFTGLFVLLRMILFVPALAQKAGFLTDKKYKAIESVAKDAPVIFTGSFQHPSLYTFFTDHPATTISSVYTRRTQFDIWQFERAFENKPVFICASVPGLSNTYKINGITFDGFFTQQFHASSRLIVEAVLPEATKNRLFHTGDTIEASFSLVNPYQFPVSFNDQEFPVTLCACFLTKKEKVVCPVVSTVDLNKIMPHETIRGNVYTIVPELVSGDYQFSFSTNSIFGPALENKMVKLKISQNDR